MSDWILLGDAATAAIKKDGPMKKTLTRAEANRAEVLSDAAAQRWALEKSYFLCAFCGSINATDIRADDYDENCRWAAFCELCAQKPDSTE